MASITATDDVSWDTTAFDAITYYSFQPNLYFDRFADVKPTRQTHRGAVVTFNKTANLAAATTPLNESTDVTPVLLSDSGVNVTLVEYGNATQTTAKLRATGYLEVDPVAASRIGENAGTTMDQIARVPFYAGTNILYSGTATSRNTTKPADTLASSSIRRAHAELLAADVPSFEGYYAAVIHPRTAHDLRNETGVASWRDPHVYSQPQNIWRGEIGEYEGFRFVVTSTALYYADAGSSTTLTDVYASIFFGRQAVAKAHSNGGGYGADPVFGRTPVTDKLERFTGYYWKHLAGYALFRQESIWRVESASSIGTNAA